MEKDEAMEYGNLVTVIQINTKDNTNKIVKMALVFINGLMEQYIKGSLKMI
jgi:hypothetical protein